MQSKRNNADNVRPSKEVCEKCESHGLCLAEDGVKQYQCYKITWLPKHKDFQL